MRKRENVVILNLHKDNKEESDYEVAYGVTWIKTNRRYRIYNINNNLI